MTPGDGAHPRRRRILRGLSTVLAVVVGVGALVVIYVTIRPIGSDTLVSRPDPASGYEDALSRWSAIEATDDGTTEPLDPRCRSYALLHGRRVETAVVLIHGYTNCPYGMKRLATALHERGWNVVVPRLPHHGYADKLTEANGLLTSEDLVETADRAVDVAVGLGDRVVVGGLSAGGVTAAWIAQNRPDVDRVVALAPLANLRPLPGWFTPQVVNAVLTAPDIETWWDSQKQAAIPPDYGYPKLSTHAVASLIRLGMATLEQARRTEPGANSIVLTTNVNDGAVNPQTVTDLVDAWRVKGMDAKIYEWPPDWRLSHNMVDDVENADRFDDVYPVLMQLFGGQA